jgi:aromatic-L-amino-acid decarboxylase
LNRSILTSIRKNKEFLISGTVLNGRCVLRVCIMNFRTTKQDVQEIVEAVRRIGKKNDALLQSCDI